MASRDRFPKQVQRSRDRTDDARELFLPGGGSQVPRRMERLVLLPRPRPAMLVFGVSLSIAALLPAQSAKNEEPILTATLTSDRMHYSLAEDIRLYVRVANAGKSPLTVFGKLLWGYAGGLVLRVTDTSNKEVPAKVLDDGMVVPSTLENPSSFVVLSPGHYLGRTRVERLSELVDKPGTYFIQVEYISPVPRDFRQGPDFWNREKPPVWSNKIEVHVTGEQEPGAVVRGPATPPRKCRPADLPDRRAEAGRSSGTPSTGTAPCAR